MPNTKIRQALLLSIGLCLGLGAVPQSLALSGITTTVSLFQGLDLDASMTRYDPRAIIIYVGDPAELESVAKPEQAVFDFGPAADAHFEFSAGSGLPLALFVHNDVQAAVLTNTTPEMIDLTALPPLALTTPTDGLVFEAADTIVLLTATGKLFALSGFTYQAMEAAVQFTVRQLQIVPEASTLMLVGLGLLLVALRKHVKS